MATIIQYQLDKLTELSHSKIAQLVESTVTNGDTTSMLVGKVTNILLDNKAIQSVNDGSYNFKKALMVRVNSVVKALNFDVVTENKVSITNEGTMYCHPVTTIIGEQEAVVHTKNWFSDPTEYQNYAVLKGSKRRFHNNSTQLLEEKQSIRLMVKDVYPVYVDLYAVLLYEHTKVNVADANYQDRLQDVAYWTKCKLGQEYTNYRKLDSNSRNYPLNRYGFAYEYGDSFEKFLIEPAKPYLVTELEVDYAKQYLRNEFDVRIVTTLVNKAKAKLVEALDGLELYNKGKLVDWQIDHKELGKLLHIVDIYENIINNLGGYSTSCASYDFTNSGGINAANQFGDEQLMKVANLLGGDKFDTHQAVATELGMPRDDAKKVMQGPNHGGRVIPEHQDMVDTIFGDNYKYIYMMSEYGMKLANNGITEVILTRPDGVKAVWYPYSTDCNVPMEDGTTVDAVMPYNSAIGTAKHRGLAVSILHSADAFTENYIQSNLYAMGYNVKTTLDNFYGQPSIKPLIVELAFEALEIMEGYAERQLQSIEQTTGILRDDNWQLPARELPLVVNNNII